MKYRKKIMVGGFFVILLGVFSFWGYLMFSSETVLTVNAEKKYPLPTAFKESGAVFREVKVQAWAEIPKHYQTLAEMTTAIQTLTGGLNPPEDFRTETHEDEYSMGITATGRTGKGYLAEITLESVKEDNAADTTYLILNFSETLDFEEIPSMEKVTSRCFAKFDGIPEISVLLAGSYDILLNNAEKKVVAKKIFKKIDGKAREMVDNGDYLSESGYSAALKNAVISDGKKINLQIAMFDNEVTSETWIYIGSPLIFSEY